MKNRNLDHKDDWMTPPDFYKKLNDEFHFDFDPCPLHHDLKLWDGLARDWGECSFVNPPYSEKLKGAFVVKGCFEKLQGRKSVFLLPVSTSTKLFHDWILPAITEPIRFIKGRLPFVGINKYGQKVNHHLIEETSKETFFYRWEEGRQKFSKKLLRYVKAAGQHDSMICIFGPK